METEQHIVMRDDGLAVRARAVRKVSKKLSLENLAVLRGQPHNPTLVCRSDGEHGERRGAGELEEQPGDDLPRYIPRMVQITREVVMKCGATRGCKKCHRMTRHTALSMTLKAVHYLMGKSMHEDDKYRVQVEAVERRQVERFAEILQRRVLEETTKVDANEERRKRRRTDQSCGAWVIFIASCDLFIAAGCRCFGDFVGEWLEWECGEEIGAWSGKFRLKNLVEMSGWWATWASRSQRQTS